MITAERAEPYHQGDSQPLIAFRLSPEQMEKRFGPPHRISDKDDDEPGPCEYRAFRFSDSQAILITYHLQDPGGPTGVVTAAKPKIEEIIQRLDISDCVTWRLDRDESKFFSQRYPEER